MSSVIKSFQADFSPLAISWCAFQTQIARIAPAAILRTMEPASLEADNLLPCKTSHRISYRSYKAPRFFRVLSAGSDSSSVGMSCRICSPTPPFFSQTRASIAAKLNERAMGSDAIWSAWARRIVALCRRSANVSVTSFTDRQPADKQVDTTSLPSPANRKVNGACLNSKKPS